MIRNYRQILIAGTTFLSGLYFFLEYVLPKKLGSFEFGAYHEQISNGVVVVGTMAIGLGVINILRVHGGSVLKGNKNSLNSFALLLGLFITLFIQGSEMYYTECALNSWQKIAVIEQYLKKIDADNNADNKLKAYFYVTQFLQQILEEHDRGKGYLAATTNSSSTETKVQTRYRSALENTLAVAQTIKQLKDLDKQSEFLQSLTKTVEAAKEFADTRNNAMPFHLTSRFIENALFFPLGAAMFSLLAFYIANAAYRSFRIRSFESVIMMCAALVVILGQIPHGPIYIWDKLPSLRLWLLLNLSTPTFRAIYFGAAVAGLAMAVRMWLSLEESPLSSEGDKA